MLGEVGPGHLRLTAAARFANGPVQAADGLHWDVTALHRHALDGLRAAAAMAPGGLASVGIDSWAVDYGLLRDGRLLAEPFHYRDERRNEVGPELVHARVVGGGPLRAQRPAAPARSTRSSSSPPTTGSPTPTGCCSCRTCWRSG